tara:strand:- start:371 stop:634 length:264 start_codon:yes stop_codon:yes gene_type:complete
VKNKQINMRDFSVTKKKGEWYDAKVTDSFGVEHQNYYETEKECVDFIYYIWESEKAPLTKEQESMLLYRAIQDCKEIDKKKLITKIM